MNVPLDKAALHDALVEATTGPDMAHIPYPITQDMVFEAMCASKHSVTFSPPLFKRRYSPLLLQNIMKLLQKYGMNFLNGLGTTLLLALISVAIGCVIGAIVAILRLGKSKMLKHCDGLHRSRPRYAASAPAVFLLFPASGYHAGAQAVQVHLHHHRAHL